MNAISIHADYRIALWPGDCNVAAGARLGWRDARFAVVPQPMGQFFYNSPQVNKAWAGIR